MKKMIAGLFAGLILATGAQVLAYGCEDGACELPQRQNTAYCYGDGSYCYDDDDAYCRGNDGACWYDDDDSYCRDNDDTYCYGDRTCGRGGWHRR